MTISVIVHPNSKAPRVEKDLLGDLHVYANEPPLKGRANEAVIEALAKHFKVKRYQISLLRGRKSKQKIFEIRKK